MITEKLGVFDLGNKMPPEFSKYFVGEAYLAPLTKKGVEIANVTFEAGCRNNWHIHHGGGQILLVTAGHGWYQAWGEQARPLVAGDVVEIPCEVKHWHGASKDSDFCHLAIAVPSVCGSTEWLEAVDDGQYDLL